VLGTPPPRRGEAGGEPGRGSPSGRLGGSLAVQSPQPFLAFAGVAFENGSRSVIKSNPGEGGSGWRLTTVTSSPSAVNENAVYSR